MVLGQARSFPVGQKRHLDVAGRKLPLDNFCLLIVSQFHSPRGNFERGQMPSRDSLGGILGDNLGVGSCESKIIPRQWGDNFCRETSRCVAGPSGLSWIEMSTIQTARDWVTCVLSSTGRKRWKTNDEKMVDFWCRSFSRFTQSFSRFVRDVNGGEKTSRYLMIFFTVSFHGLPPLDQHMTHKLNDGQQPLQAICTPQEGLFETAEFPCLQGVTCTKVWGYFSRADPKLAWFGVKLA